ncbi:Rqc1p KNAG_0C05330 [Huiozyma naganishii CBS 8797]|uniref:Ribosome quality control complex subunit 1 n=1 Tax=Huiozyma naganishii (strain ATCC MYA-139 / BCRC 22969 / CBS 8797 / KCTC 17520 / NBRC 10181 / NCYC 3082 / Yp74L-3) TaxID=1071383 RepID=J7S6A3_HUIN7|nr:hypothetical protein KNAG_0C05330 [Kazachstania naganishii CBS 8797]CCK69631.1 hypothetical protein KNAG_0C05330 [Kazachstania naganishii CBS 8797]
MSSRALRKLQNDDDLLASILAKSAPPNGDSEDHQPTIQNPKKQNFFALMNDEEGEDDNDDGVGSEEESNFAEPVKVTVQTKSAKKANKKRKQKKKNQAVKGNHVQENDENENDDDDSDFERLILKFQKKDIAQSRSRTFDGSDEYFTASESENEDNTREADASDIITRKWKYDNAFTKFPIKSLHKYKNLFNTDFKKLDPHTEFKLLFDDISAESLEDIDSMSSTAISPQYLKQIQRMKRIVRNWGGKDHRSVPNGPGGSVHRLQFTKVRNDWLPTPRGELSMKMLSQEDVLDWQLWQRPTDWKDVIMEDVKRWQKYVTFYKFEPLNTDLNKKAMTEFYLNVIANPDHEALVNLVASQFPYFVPGLLQVALITVRQGDRSNTNGLLQRALFVFDRALKATLSFDSLSCQLPYIYFYNRQFYLTIFRYILTLSQRGAMATASEWCKVLWSLSPLEDPLGCRYFIDHYLLLSNDYQTMISMSTSALMNWYKEWYTLGFSLGTVLSYLRIEDFDKAKLELQKCFNHHFLSLCEIYLEKLAGEPSLVSKIKTDYDTEDRSQVIILKSYMTRFSQLWSKTEDITFLRSELTKLLEAYKRGEINLGTENKANCDDGFDELDNPFFIEDIPINLLRFVILSEESSVMGSIPTNIWSDYEVFEFDVLTPTATTKESLDVLENVKTFINDKDLLESQAAMIQDEDILNQIRQLSLNQYIQQHETPHEEQH